MHVTFLGHQGWLLESQDVAVLVDPLFTNEFGRGPRGARFPLKSLRNFDLTKLPSINAIILSHEHEDHFNIPTLMNLPRTIPIFFSALSSYACPTILKEMGFQASPVFPGEILTFGEMRIHMLGPDHLEPSIFDEWDTLAYHAYDLGTGGASSPTWMWEFPQQ